MANTIYWGQAAVENTNGFGKAATNNNINFGEVCADSWSPETNLTGTAATPSFSNTLSTTFDGIDDRIDLSSTLTFSGEFSFNWWMKPQGYTTNSKAYIWGRWGSNTDFLKLNSASSITLKIGGTSRTITNSSGNTIDLNVWSQICLTRDSSNNIKAYVNGTLFGSVSASTILRVQSIGRIINNGFGFLGEIDEVSFFNTTLTQSDITAIYNGGVPTSLLSYSSLVSWYRMGDNDTYPIISDNKGSNDGTMNAMSSANFVADVPT